MKSQERQQFIESCRREMNNFSELHKQSKSQSNLKEKVKRIEEKSTVDTNHLKGRQL